MTPPPHSPRLSHAQPAHLSPTINWIASLPLAMTPPLPVISRSEATRQSRLFLHHQLDCFAPARNDVTLPVIASEGEAIQLKPASSLPRPTCSPLANHQLDCVAPARNDATPLPTRHSLLTPPPTPTLDTTTAPLPPELEQVHWKYPPFFHGTGAEWRSVGVGLASGQKAAKRRWTCRERVFISPHDRTVQAPSAIARVAQLVEQATENRCVGGSIPPSGTTHFPQ
jgi:hypothetical protein